MSSARASLVSSHIPSRWNMSQRVSPRKTNRLTEQSITTQTGQVVLQEKTVFILILSSITSLFSISRCHVCQILRYSMKRMSGSKSNVFLSKVTRTVQSLMYTSENWTNFWKKKIFELKNVQTIASRYLQSNTYFLRYLCGLFFDPPNKAKPISNN